MTKEVGDQSAAVPPPSYYSPLVNVDHLPFVYNDQVVQQHTQPKPNDYLIFSVSNLLCFNALFGLIALYFSIKSRDSYHTHQYSNARRFSKRALYINIAALITGIFFWILTFFYIGFMLHWSMQIEQLNKQRSGYLQGF
jgi:hypothetical protein